MGCLHSSELVFIKYECRKCPQLCSEAFSSAPTTSGSHSQVVLPLPGHFRAKRGKSFLLALNLQVAHSVSVPAVLGWAQQTATRELHPLATSLCASSSLLLPFCPSSVGRAWCCGQPLKPSSITTSAQPVTSGASASSCGKSCPMARDPTGTCPTRT